MDSRARVAFLLLILSQAAHSVEEYAFRLFDVFPPAHFVSTMLSSNPARGFAIANVGIVLSGVFCYVSLVKPGHPAERAVAWFWLLLELGNGVGHTIMAMSRAGYFPGVATAPALVGISLYLGGRLTVGDGRNDRPGGRART